MIYLVHQVILGITRTIKICNNVNELTIYLNSREFKKRFPKGKIIIENVRVTY